MTQPPPNTIAAFLADLAQSGQKINRGRITSSGLSQADQDLLLAALDSGNIQPVTAAVQEEAKKAGSTAWMMAWIT
jgi:predicted ThiF/HesA family dinucleotide-utilizing enzyme